MQPGQMIKMKTYDGEAILVVVKLDGNHVNVCTSEEFKKAKKERREPIAVGFSIEDVVEENVVPDRYVLSK